MGNSSTKQGSEIGRSKRLALNLRTPTLSSRADFTHAAHGDLIDPTDNQADIVDVVNTVQSLGTADTDFDTVPQAQRCPKSLNAPSTQPLVFFANQGNSDPYFLYNTALIFKRNGKYFEAREKLRETLKYKSAIADDARLHLAQCLVALDPFLKSCRTELLDLLCVHRNERESQCFTGMEDNNRNGEELLANVCVGLGYWQRALECFVNMESLGTQTQQFLVDFQIVCCTYHLSNGVYSSQTQGPSTTRNNFDAASLLAVEL